METVPCSGFRVTVRPWWLLWSRDVEIFRGYGSHVEAVQIASAFARGRDYAIHFDPPIAV